MPLTLGILLKEDLLYSYLHSSQNFPSSKESYQVLYRSFMIDLYLFKTSHRDSIIFVALMVYFNLKYQMAIFNWDFAKGEHFIFETMDS